MKNRLPTTTENVDRVLLFRTQAMSARRDAWLGRTILLRPISVTMSVMCGLVVVGLILSYLILGQYTRRVRLTGIVLPSAGVIRIFAPNAGRIVVVGAKDNEAVDQGQSLYTIASGSTTSFGETQAAIAIQLRKQRAELEGEINRRQKLDVIEKAGLIEQQQGLLREIEQTQLQIKTTADYASVLDNISETYKALVARHIVLQREAFDRLESRMRKNQELEALRREATQLDQRLAETKTKLAGFDSLSATAISDLNRQISVIDRDMVEGEARRQVEVVAPRAGIVTAILVKEGQVVAAGTPLLSILPDETQLEVHLFGPSTMIGFMRENVPVLLRYAAFPYQKFGLQPGTVTGFSRVTLNPRDVEVRPLAQDLSETTQTSSSGVYRIIVKPKKDHVLAYGKAEPVRPGMAVEADIFLDTRHIYEWLLEPIYSIGGTFSDAGIE